MRDIGANPRFSLDQRREMARSITVPSPPSGRRVPYCGKPEREGPIGAGISASSEGRRPRLLGPVGFAWGLKWCGRWRRLGGVFHVEHPGALGQACRY